jgi:hypothetical protein
MRDPRIHLSSRLFCPQHFISHPAHSTLMLCGPRKNSLYFVLPLSVGRSVHLRISTRDAIILHYTDVDLRQISPRCSRRADLVENEKYTWHENAAIVETAR